MRQEGKGGFTLVELMIIVAIIGILSAIGIVNYGNSVRKSSDAMTKGNLGAIRSALSIYYSDNEGIYPIDNLTSINKNDRYLAAIPITRIQPYHPDISHVTAEDTPSETGGWSYDNDSSDLAWGTVLIGCMHTDNYGEVWSTY